MVPAPAAGLVLLDRDGVINRDSDQYIRRVEDWVPLPGSLEAIARLTGAGYRIAVVTNQSGVGRGLFSEGTLAEIHAAMRTQVESAGGAIAGVYYCPHRPDQNCDCRKPKPALLLQALQELDADAGSTCYIGDKTSDVVAALAAGVQPILVGSDVRGPETAGVEHYADLPAAVSALLGGAGRAR